jgi:hypothetical protein
MQYIDSLFEIHDIHQPIGVFVESFAQLQYAGAELWKRLNIQRCFAVLHLAQAMAEGGLDRDGQSREVVLAAADPYDGPSDQLGNKVVSSAGPGRGVKGFRRPISNMVNLPLTCKWLFSAAAGPFFTCSTALPYSKNSTVAFFVDALTFGALVLEQNFLR